MIMIIHNTVTIDIKKRLLVLVTNNLLKSIEYLVSWRFWNLCGNGGFLLCCHGESSTYPYNDYQLAKPLNYYLQS